MLLLERACYPAAVALSPSDEQGRPLPSQPVPVRAAEVLTVLPARTELPQGLVTGPLPLLGPSPFPGASRSSSERASSRAEGRPAVLVPQRHDHGRRDHAVQGVGFRSYPRRRMGIGASPPR